MNTKPLLYLLLAATLAAPSLTLAAEGKAPTAQQQRMKSCNAEAKAKALKGEERKTFMSGCLKGEPAAGTDKQARRD
jgi:hypothetical protein